MVQFVKTPYFGDLLEISPPKTTGVTIEDTELKIVSSRQNFLLQKGVHGHMDTAHTKGQGGLSVLTFLYN
jgi:hypothetical protein